MGRAWLLLGGWILWVPALGAGQVSPSAPGAAMAEAVAPAQSGPRSGSVHSGSDTLAYWYGPSYRTPFVFAKNSGRAAGIPRSSIECNDLRFWSLGSSFADVMVNQSGMAEPAAGGGSGATEIYATLRTDIGLNEITNSQSFHCCSH